MKKKIVSLMLATLMAVSAMSGLDSGGGSVHAADDLGVSDAECIEEGVAEPEPDEVLPDANQYKYQKDELAAFCHFGPNTFNEIEWGQYYGDKKPDEIFKLREDFDADTLVDTLQKAGFKKLIVTAKHHDGFCIWPSKYTEYDVEKTSYKNGKGDILAEISAACSKADMDMGLYLSPWDIHDPSYGYHPSKEEDDADYNEYYDNQLIEILSNEKYGNKGRFVEVWMDGAKGNGANAQEYDFDRWFNTIQKYEGIEDGAPADCMLFGAGARTTVRWIGNEDGFAGEETWAKSYVNPQTNGMDNGAVDNATGKYTAGIENGNKWTVPEADTRITSGWFWGTQKKTPKTITELGNMYFNTVGHNATLLLNVPPNDKGKTDQEILNRVEEFGQQVQDTFRTNLAKNATITAGNVRENGVAFRPGTTVDGDDATYWTTTDGVTSSSLTLNWDTKQKFDVVSIEEAIQKGQHINSYKVEYRADDASEWVTLKEGRAIGAKRLIRTSPVTAKQVRITVGTTEGKVPMLSEIGVYKASDGFELASTAPTGMEVIDVNEFDKFSEGWTKENGVQYINGTNQWAKNGASFEINFTGSKIYLLGTKDPGHGAADIYIDNEMVDTINTTAASREVGAKIYTSKDLEHGKHTLKLVTKEKAIGVEAAYVINNGGVGMVGIEEASYTMGEEESLDVKITRVGGTNGPIKFKLAPNPGSAIQDDYNTENQKEVTIENGEKEVTVQGAAITKRNTNMTGDQYFYLQMEEQDPDTAILGFNSKSKIIIKDKEGLSKEKLTELVESCNGMLSDWYTSGWDKLQKKLADARTILEKEAPTDAEIKNAYVGLEDAVKALVKREKYTADAPFVFPWRNGSSATLEAEFATELKDSKEEDSKPNFPLKVIPNDEWASNGKFVNNLSYKDFIEYAYLAEKPGTYEVVLSYRSGSKANKIQYSEKDNKIETKTVEAGADSSAKTNTVTFEIDVKTAGPGTLILTAPDTNNGPQLDKFTITPKKVTLSSYKITASAGEHGSIELVGDTDVTDVTEGEDATYTITADEGYAVADVQVDGVSVGAVNSYTFKDVEKAHTISATFKFNNFTEANPFVFPTVPGTTKTLEAEQATVLENSDAADSDPDYPLTITTDSSASNGKYVNCLAHGDYVKYAYKAEVAGTYEVVLTYRSGSNANKIAWSEAREKIVAGQKEAGATDPSQKQEAKFEIEVTEPGQGLWIFTAPDSGKGPQMDKFEITLKGEEGGELPELDKTALQAAREEAEKWIVQTDKYTENSLKVLQDAMDAADLLLAEDAVTTQEALKAATDALNDAIENLKEIGAPEETVDKDELLIVRGQAAELVVQTDTYTKDSLDVLQAAIERANALLEEDAETTQDAVNAAVSALKNAIESLKEIETPGEQIDKSGLLEVRNQAAGLAAQTDKYTADSIAALNQAIAAADALLAADAVTTQDEVNAAIEVLNQAIGGLQEVEIPEVQVDKTALQEARNRAAELVGQTDIYTAESLATLQSAMDEADKLLAEDAVTTQDAVNAAADALNQAIDGLKKLDSDNPNGGNGGSGTPSDKPSDTPSDKPSDKPSNTPSGKPSGTPSDKTSQTPKTGDNSAVAGWSVLCVAAGMTALAAGKKKKGKRS